ncbi:MULTISPECIES: hypothetical protein [unclassified Pseudomonas]|uniref:hypothetical protein n=1 Tax=unclassified Pseudomonas TaxID=196821 RepID=UPI0025D02D6B|nr:MULTISPECIES: hypothetical protein [unclassified Pseudomonas]
MYAQSHHRMNAIGLEKGDPHPSEESADVDVDVDNDPGNEDPGSQFDRDATVPLIAPDE